MSIHCSGGMNDGNLGSHAFLILSTHSMSSRDSQTLLTLHIIVIALWI